VLEVQSDGYIRLPMELQQRAKENYLM